MSIPKKADTDPLRMALNASGAIQPAVPVQAPPVDGRQLANAIIVATDGDNGHLQTLSGEDLGPKPSPTTQPLVYWDNNGQMQLIQPGTGCTPGTGAAATLGSATEGSETADTNAWAAGGAGGLEVWQVCRVVYNDAGDAKLYAFVRKFTYNSCGALTSVTGETRVTVDIPEAC